MHDTDRRIRVDAICVLLFCAIAIASRATTITVTSTNDSGPGSLRQALADASDGDVINFDPSLNGQAIRLTTPALVIDDSISITGPGPDLLAICRGSNDCFSSFDRLRATDKSPRVRPQGIGLGIFHVMPGHVVTISGLTISYGHDTGGGIFNDQSSLTVDDCTIWGNLDDSTSGGGGIHNAGATANLMLSDSRISGNSAFGGYGGGIYNESGTAIITNSAITNNVSPLLPLLDGGGIWNGGMAEITNCMITGNFAGGLGGGIRNAGKLILTNSTLSGNHAGTNLGGSGYGGGIYNSGTLEITNSSITENNATGKSSGWGGGISSQGSVEIRNTTFSGNYAGVHGGTIYGGTFGIANSILNAGTPENISGGNVTSHGYNIASDNAGGFLTGPGDQININPLIGPLQDNGGPTFTHELLPGSPAIDTGDPNFMPPPFYDQRGLPFVRVFNSRIDIGSFELQPAPAPTPTPRPTSTPRPRPTPQVQR
jgi:hypothetical protein